MKKLLLLVIAGAAAVWLARQPAEAPRERDGEPSAFTAGEAEDRIAVAFANRERGVGVEGRGTVEKLLGDDSLGDRHQRFILRLPSGQTVLVTHNIDLAPRVEPLAVGDTVAFRGEYEWNDKGGIVHWTHHDPAGRRPGGWLKHEGRTFE
ncbi:MAG TPA: DUF3465 domain-containing protein [Steroidobacteraceae bacterium]|nr:DUF3465 domain-containing protein [Steroidobacteraceae bacterium]